MRGNTVTLPLIAGRVTKSPGLYQWDYGQVLKLKGVELPRVYEVHFANAEHGEMVTVIGDANGVEIPDALLQTGANVHVWLFLHDDVTDGETEYHGIIPVTRRAQPEYLEPTPEQEDAITQAIAQLNKAVEDTGDSAAAAAESQRQAAASQRAAADSETAAAESKRQAAGSASAAADSASAAAESKRQAAESEADAAESALKAEGWAVGTQNGTAVQAGQLYFHDNSKFYADRAEQAAKTAGYMDIYIDENGDLIYVRTSAVDVDFALENGDLIMEVT